MGAIQVKNVPDALHDRLRERAEGEGMTIGSYVLSVIERDLALPSRREWFEGLHSDVPIEIDTVAIIQEGRLEREEQLDRALRR